jgi:DnaK suppressor protein
MIDARYAKLKQMLEIRRRELQQNLDAKLRDVRANNGHDGELGALDAAEASDSDLQREIAISLTEMTAEMLRRVDEALERLTRGVYGDCAECDGEISLNRLMAVPFALRCRECEELREVDERRSRPLQSSRSNPFTRFDADSRD